MTAKGSENQKKSLRLDKGQLLFCVMGITSLVLAFLYSEETISAMSAGMRLCVNTVIPSLFPFMVLSELFVASGAAQLLGRIFGLPLSKMLGVSGEGSVAWLLGIFCGFPVGIRCAVSLYERGRISRAELEHLCAFCNGPSSAFLISAVGSSLFGSKKLGILLYLAHIISSLIIGVCSRPYFSRQTEKKSEYCLSEINNSKDSERFSSCFSRAVTSSASSMLFICAFVIFFSALTGFLRMVCSALCLSRLLQAVIFGFFEMTGGAVAASELTSRIAVPIVAALTGWSGMSVHFQLVGILGPYDVPFSPYVVCKAFSSLLCCVSTTALVNIFGKDISLSERGSVASLFIFDDVRVPLITLAAFSLACAALILRVRPKK